MSTQSFAVIAVHKNSKMYAQNTTGRKSTSRLTECETWRLDDVRCVFWY